MMRVNKINENNNVTITESYVHPFAGRSAFNLFFSPSYSELDLDSA